MSNKTHTARYNALIDEALKRIASYRGEQKVVLKNGQIAIDNDDAWIILEKEPFLRDKRDQSRLDRGVVTDSSDFEDMPLRKAFSAEQIFELADKIAEEEPLRSYRVGVYLPLSLCVTVRAASRKQAICSALAKALNIPLSEWDDDYSKATAEVLD